MPKGGRTSVSTADASEAAPICELPPLSVRKKPDGEDEWDCESSDESSVLKLVEHPVGADVFFHFLASHGSVCIRSVCKTFDETADKAFRMDHHTKVSEEVITSVNKNLIRWLNGLPQPPPPEHVLFSCAQHTNAPEILDALPSVSSSFSWGGKDEGGGVKQMRRRDDDEKETPGWGFEKVQQIANFWAAVKGAVKGGNDGCLRYLAPSVYEELKALGETVITIGKPATRRLSHEMLQHDREWVGDGEWFGELIRKGLWHAVDDMKRDSSHPSSCISVKRMLEPLADVSVPSLIEGCSEEKFDRFMCELVDDFEYNMLWVRVLKGQTAELMETDFPKLPPELIRSWMGWYSSEEVITKRQMEEAVRVVETAFSLLSAASAMKEKGKTTEMATSILEWIGKITETLDGGTKERVFHMWRNKTDPDHLVRAAKRGDLDFIQVSRRITPDSPTFAMSYLCTNAAARGGDRETFQWLIENGCDCMWEPVTMDAAESGSLEVMEYIKKYSTPNQDLSRWPVICCTAAEQAGQFDALRWLRSAEPPCPWGPSPEAGDGRDIPLEARIFEVTLAEALARGGDDEEDLPLPPAEIAGSVKEFALKYAETKYSGPFGLEGRLRGKAEARLLKWFLKVGGAAAKRKAKSIFQKNSVRAQSEYLAAYPHDRETGFLDVWSADLEKSFTPRGIRRHPKGEITRFAKGSSRGDASSLHTRVGFETRLNRKLENLAFLWNFAEKNYVPLVRGERGVERSVSLTFKKMHDRLVGLQSLFGHAVLEEILKRVKAEGGEALKLG